MISCVPRQTFEFGPRDYLTKIVSVISSLRGGQQRYLPILMSKINEAMPSVPLSPSLIREDGTPISEGAPLSATESLGHHPFSSPALSTVSPQSIAFAPFPHAPAGVMALAPAPAPITTGVVYDAPVVSAPLQMLQTNGHLYHDSNDVGFGTSA